MKKQMKTLGTSILAVALSAIMVFFSVLGITRTADSSSANALVRTVTLEDNALTSMDAFDSYTISDDNGVPSFHGTSKYYEDDGLFFDNLALEEDKENYSLDYSCYFDMDALEYHLTISLLDVEGQVVDTESIVSPAIVTSTGMLDAYIEIDGETYLVSDLENQVLNDCICGWLVAAIIVVAVVVVYHAVTETAEQIRLKENYKYNQQLETDGKGVTLGNYITRQKETNNTGYNCGNYRFGFTTFAGVGCEVASAYNALIALGKSELLSETIKTFEKKAIEYAVAWGNFGSDPKAMTKFFDDRGITYSKYTSMSKFKTAVDKKTNCYIIMSRWNDPWTGGLHTFYIEKNKSWSTPYHSYNFQYKDPNTTVDKSEIDDFNNGDGFIVGYILSVS